jgi:hypothetical protein
MALASVALDVARSKLNDAAGTRWTDAALLTYLQQAHRELQVRLDLEGLPVIQAVTVALTVPALVTDFSTVVGYPTDLVEPQWMKEKQVGQQDRDFVNMVEVSFIPQLQQDPQRLNYWCWQEEKILFLGSTTDVIVQLRYLRGLPAITSGSSPIGFIFGENYLGPRCAALAGDPTGDDTGFQRWTDEANANIDAIVRMNVKGLQALPARRQPYHRRRSWVRTLRGM